MQYTLDVARAFVAAARAEVDGAHVFNLGGQSVEMADVVAAIEQAAPDVAGRVTIDGAPLPFPAAASDGRLMAAIGGFPRTSLIDGVAATVERFRSLIANGSVVVPESV